MPNESIRRGAKIGRNDPCFCGSGQKFKRCHGALQNAESLLHPNDGYEKSVKSVLSVFEENRIKETRRIMREGFGRPMVTTELNGDLVGNRVVAVGGEVFFGKWRSFTEFLFSYVKHLLSEEWCDAEAAKPFTQRHILLQWHEKVSLRLESLTGSRGAGPHLVPVTGAISAYIRLAYNLYLIAHNNVDVQTRLVHRLKNKEGFQGAFYEIQVAAWLIKAGFQLEFEDETDRKSKHCEFTATYKNTGDKFSVEAKSRELELMKQSREKICRKLRDALSKDAKHKRIVFLDLNKPLHTQEAADMALKRAQRIIRGEEIKGIEIGGKPAPSAYLFITNMNDQYAVDVPDLATMVMFRGFKIPDLKSAGAISIRETSKARRRHWPIFQLLKSMEWHSKVPQSFEDKYSVDGGAAVSRFQVGGFYSVLFSGSQETMAQLVLAQVNKGMIQGVFYDPVTHMCGVGSFDMTAEELEHYSENPETYFSKNPEQNPRVTSPEDAFDFFSTLYRDVPRERLLEMLLIVTAADRDGLIEAAQEELIEMLAEDFAWKMFPKYYSEI